MKKKEVLDALEDRYDEVEDNWQHAWSVDPTSVQTRKLDGHCNGLREAVKIVEAMDD